MRHRELPGKQLSVLEKLDSYLPSSLPCRKHRPRESCLCDAVTDWRREMGAAVKAKSFLLLSLCLCVLLPGTCKQLKFFLTFWNLFLFRSFSWGEGVKGQNIFVRAFWLSTDLCVLFTSTSLFSICNIYSFNIFTLVLISSSMLYTANFSNLLLWFLVEIFVALSHSLLYKCINYSFL